MLPQNVQKGSYKKKTFSKIHVVNTVAFPQYVGKKFVERSLHFFPS